MRSLLPGPLIFVRCLGVLAILATTSDARADAPRGAKDSSATTAHAAVDFDTEIVPVLTHAGCNQGACHGSAAGRGGFKLSLLGSDPERDHRAIVHQFEGRRVNLARPSRSLILRKPTGQVDHGGDIRLDLDGAGAARIERWIAEGARRLSRRSLTELVVEPAELRAGKPGDEVTVRVEARFDDGARRDVTHLTVFTPQDASALQALDARPGAFRVARRGAHVLVARFLDRVLPVRCIVPPGARPVELAIDESTSRIDRRVLERLEELQLQPAGAVDDATFLRRATLALTGRLPRVAVIEAFLEDSGPEKRREQVERLLDSDAFVDYWTFRLGLWLRVRSVRGDRQLPVSLRSWLRAQVAADRGLDRVVADLLTVLGDSHGVAPSGFHRLASDARDEAELVSEVFLGVRLRCANCHDHPLDRWTQDDYHGLAAIFARLDRGREVTWKSFGEVTHPRTGEAARPRIPGERFLDEDDAPLKALSSWLVKSENSSLARNVVNRVWQSLLGRGLVEPVDDLRPTNPPTHPRLLEELATQFRRDGYRLKPLLRSIVRSQTFARATAGLDADPRHVLREYYTHFSERRLEAEVLADAIDAVTAVPTRYEQPTESARTATSAPEDGSRERPGAERDDAGSRGSGQIPPPTRAVALADPSTPSPELDSLGRCDREEGCAGGSVREPDLAMQLRLLNGEFLNGKIESENGRLAAWLRAGKSNRDIVAGFYRLALSRPPRAHELEHWESRLPQAPAATRRAALEDFLWSLLVSEEFTTLH